MCWNPSFQDLPDATIWERNRATCYAAGRVFLACLLPVRLVLFLELLAPFRAARQTPWVQEALTSSPGSGYWSSMASTPFMLAATWA
jgi:hypothetical protein